MTLVTEHRWRCEYCKNVSPVFDIDEEIPMGWLMHSELTNHGWESHHFCCIEHKDFILFGGNEHVSGL
jgi:hypothetical protein